MAYGYSGGIGESLMDISRMLMSYQMDKNKDLQLQKRKDQADKAAKLLEESRVARTSKPYLKKGSPTEQSPWVSKEAGGYMTPQGGPDQVSVDEFNSQGRLIGTRLAAPSEAQGYQSEQEALELARTAAQAKAKSQAEKDDLARRRAEAGILRDTTAANLTNARLANPEKYGSRGKGKSPEDDVTELQREVAGMLSNPDIQAALKASDPGLLAEIGQQQGFVDKAIGGVKSALGVENNDGSIWSELSKSQNDPELQAQMWRDLLRRIQQSTIKARGRGAGIAAPRNQE